MPGPLEGIRVLDLTIWQQGTVAGAMLADMGADVIKIEGPDSPDPGRSLSGWKYETTPGGAQGYYETHNRNKRGIVLDLKTEAGRQVLYRLVRGADVFLANLRPDAVKKMKVDYESLRPHNPRLVYGQATGYGDRGPLAEFPSMDPMAQARGGVMSVTGEEGRMPVPLGVPYADQTGGALLAWGVTLALFHRQRTGQGQYVQSSLLAGQIFAQGFTITNYLFTRRPPERLNRTNAYPLWNQYQAGDGKWFIIGLPNPERWWGPFCRAIGHPELDQDGEGASSAANPENFPGMVARLDELFATQPRDYWVRTLQEAGLMCDPVQDYEELIRDPQVLANDLVVDYERHGERLRMVGLPVTLSETPGAITRPAPEFGQHTEEVLLEYGFTWEEVAALRQEGAIGPRSATADVPAS